MVCATVRPARPPRLPRPLAALLALGLLAIGSVNGAEPRRALAVVPEPIVLQPVAGLLRAPAPPAAPAAAAVATRFDSPLRARFRLSSAFGLRVHPLRRHRHLHSGADLAAPRGTPVHAVADGIVSSVRSTRPLSSLRRVPLSSLSIRIPRPGSACSRSTAWGVI